MSAELKLRKNQSSILIAENNKVKQKLNERKGSKKIIENEIVRQVIEEQIRSLDYQFLRKVIGWYLVWVVHHLGILLSVRMTNSHYIIWERVNFGYLAPITILRLVNMM